MFRSNHLPELKSNINLAPYNAMLTVLFIFCLFLKQFIFVYFIIILFVLFYLDKRLALNSTLLIEDDEHHIYPIVDSTFQYKIFVQSDTTQSFKIRFGLEHNQFSNHNSSITIETNVSPKLMNVIHLPIEITQRGRFKVIIYDIEIQGYFKLLRYTVKQKVNLSNLYASYGTYNEKHMDQLQTLDDSGKRVLGQSSDKYSNTEYQYDTPFHLIDFNASLKANQLLVKQTEVYETNHVVLTANVLSHQHIHHQIEPILKALSDYAYTYYYHLIPFIIALNIKTNVTSQASVLINIQNSNDISTLHKTIAAFNQDSYTFQFGALVTDVLATHNVHQWIHFGDITDHDLHRIKQQQIHFKRGAIDG